jgi:hypothetical protein
MAHRRSTGSTATRRPRGWTGGSSSIAERETAFGELDHVLIAVGERRSWQGEDRRQHGDEGDDGHEETVSRVQMLVNGELLCPCLERLIPIAPVMVLRRRREWRGVPPRRTPLRNLGLG